MEVKDQLDTLDLDAQFGNGPILITGAGRKKFIMEHVSHWTAKGRKATVVTDNIFVNVVTAAGADFFNLLVAESHPEVLMKGAATQASRNEKILLVFPALPFRLRRHIVFLSKILVPIENVLVIIGSMSLSGTARDNFGLVIKRQLSRQDAKIVSHIKIQTPSLEFVGLQDKKSQSMEDGILDSTV